MDIGESLQGLWDGLLDLTSQFVIPDWGSLIGLLPVFLVIGVLGPILSILLLVHLIYFLRKPRGPLAEPPEPVRAPIGDDGRPVLPAGEPFCFRDGLIYPANVTRCDECGDDLSVRCPKCSVTRLAREDTCANCGLVLKIRTPNQVVRAAKAPPGGRAIA